MTEVETFDNSPSSFPFTFCFFAKVALYVSNSCYKLKLFLQITTKMHWIPSNINPAVFGCGWLLHNKLIEKYIMTTYDNN